MPSRYSTLAPGRASWSPPWSKRSSPGHGPPRRIDIVAYEINRALHPHLGDTLALCMRACAERGVALTYMIRGEDYIAAAADMLDGACSGGRPISSISAS